MKLHIKLLFRKQREDNVLPRVSDFRIALYVTIETKYFNYFMKLLNKTGWLNEKPQNIRVGKKSIPKQVVCYEERPCNLSQTLNQEHYMEFHLCTSVG